MPNLFKRDHSYLPPYAIVVMMLMGGIRQFLGRNNINKCLANAFIYCSRSRSRSRRPHNSHTVTRTTSQTRSYTSLSSSSSVEDTSGKDTTAPGTRSSTNRIIFHISTPDDMEDLGGLLATLTVAPTAIFLDGDLGAGKTALSRGYLRTVTSDPELLVTSPTYLLSNVYPTPQYTVYHMDLYRLAQKQNIDEIRDLLRPLNLNQIFTKDVTLMEWPERLGPAYKQRNSQEGNLTMMWPVLPPERLEVDIRITQRSTGSTSKEEEEKEEPEGDMVDIQSRVVTLTPVGTQWTSSLQDAIDEGFVEDFLFPDDDDV